MEKLRSLYVDYKSNKSDLCEIGKKYDTDKSSQRLNANHYRHCHPYTIFYNSLFQNKKNENLKIAEIGILEGSSLLMWQEYFKHSDIDGFEYDNSLIEKFRNNFNNERITLSEINVQCKDNISNAFANSNKLYDIIIEDSTHQFEDQIRVIENIYQYIKPGGILIIEDIFKSYDEQSYITRLSPILEHFQDYYFITLDHENKISTGWDNDKLFILVKSGAEPIFKNENKISIITPSYRTDNLFNVRNSIDFNFVDEWIIVYDGSKIKENPYLFRDENNCKIKEYVFEGEGISGNPQRNYALTQISNPDTFIYYLDDDNIINSNLYRLINIIDKNKLYTFNQVNRIKGNNINLWCIDTAMLLIHKSLCNDITWKKELYDADGYYIIECYEKNKNLHIFVDNDLCYYNYLSQ